MEISKIKELRAVLHACSERSGQEHLTKAALLQFLHENTSMDLSVCGNGFYAAHRESKYTKRPIALRADYDALAVPGGGAAHLCGHDGHASVLCGVALALEEQLVGRDVFLLFQPEEETGTGAEGCLSLFQGEVISEIYGAHNLPGFPLGQIVTRPGTFACGSEGLVLRLTGKAAHAAYPEDGVNPAGAVGALLCALPELSAPGKYGGMVLCTVIGVQMGEKAFGAAAADAELWLTLRAEREADLCVLRGAVLELAEKLAAQNGLSFSYEEQDRFPATENDPERAKKVLSICGGTLLPEPMRWSEDFGHFLRHCPGAFFGIGAGLSQPPLHTQSYEYPDELLEPTIQAFMKLLLSA